MNADNTNPGLWGALKEVYNGFSEDDAMSQAAALSFYTGLAIAPLLTLAVWITRGVMGDGGTDRIVMGFEQIMGPEAAESIRELIDPASEQANQGMTLAGIISLGILLFSATGVLVQLQTALNRMWSVEQKPTAGVMGFVRKRLLSFGMLLVLLFLLLVSGILGAVIHGILPSDGTGAWAQIVNMVVSLIVFVPLFALLFKYIPDATVRWNDVWVGAAITAVLFVVGKFGLSIYLGRSDYGSSYGAAVGSFVAMLVWVYYSAIIVFIGAEATQIYARRSGHAVMPNEHAVRVVKKTVPAPD